VSAVNLHLLIGARMNLLEWRSNVYSQNGEDGIVAELLTRLNIRNGSPRWCVEFGAWDGKYLSNTFHLVESAGWNAVYIEGDPERFLDLQSTALQFSKVVPILGMVGGSKGEGPALDDLLRSTDVPSEYDILSVDIDSSDLDVWLRHVNYRPRIVIIEINSSIAPGILQWHGDQVQGNSFSSTVNVASHKGYTLVCHTGNLIFVKDEIVDQVGLNEFDLLYPERLFLWDSVPQRGFVKHQAARVRGQIPNSVKKPLRKFLRR